MNIAVDIFCREVDAIPAGTSFMVKDLVPGWKWNRIPAEDRARICTYFGEEISSGVLKGKIAVLGKGIQNSYIYQKV